MSDEVESCDVLIIGGGIAGCGLARDLALRGVNSILIEKDDFGSGTTSKSTRIIHGGIRYLENLEFGLVREGLRERSILLDTAPGLVKPLRFILPLYRGGSPGRWRIKLGMVAYDFLSFRKMLPRHKFIGADETLDRIPDLNPEGLIGSYVYFDAQVSRVERLCLENVLSGESQGCKALNHCEVTGLKIEGNQAKSASVRSHLTGREWTIRSRVFVNCTGPWADEFLKLASLENSDKLLGVTKGVHLVGSRLSDDAIVLYSSKDGRLFFVIPWMNSSLIGTTDTPFIGSTDSVTTEVEDVTYLLDSLEHYFPSVDLKCFASYAGLRPLVRANRIDPSKISRKYSIVESGGVDNLLTLAGVKITEYRSASQKAGDLVCRKLSLKSTTKTRKTVLTEKVDLLDLPALYEKFLSRELCEYLISIYGSKAKQIVAEAIRDSSLSERLCKHNPDIVAQVWYALKSEHAKTVNDFMLRRTSLSFTECKGIDALDKIASIMARHLGWTEKEVADQKASYAAYISDRDKALELITEGARKH
jgi:glycerol-3-phosphate dehydrogenase